MLAAGRRRRKAGVLSRMITASTEMVEYVGVGSDVLIYPNPPGPGARDKDGITASG